MFHSLWPKFKVLMSKKGRVHDDALWLEPITIEQALLNNEPLMVRHHMVRYPHLHETIIARSVMPVRTHQDKTYGIKMGWWRTVRLGEPLPWDEHFVLKPFKSWGSKDVMCWIPDDRRGRSTRTQIENTLRKHDSMILQPYIEPTKINIAGVPHNSILRPFFGYNPHTDAWVPMGGLWTARPSPNLRIHGTSDAISGPLIIEE
jgi:hypothetical protein